jgi:hypothetical protein
LSAQRTHRVISSSQSKNKQSNKSSAEISKASATPKETPNPKPISKKVDDEEKPKPESAGNRLQAWANERGDPLSLVDWWSIKDTAASRGLSLDELADLAEKNAGNWKSSAAGLRWLIKQFSRKTSEAPKEIEPPKPVEKCLLCKCAKGEGVFIEDGGIKPCECATPEWREKLAQALARDAAAKAARAVRVTVTSEAVA